MRWRTLEGVQEAWCRFIKVAFPFGRFLNPYPTPKTNTVPRDTLSLTLLFPAGSSWRGAFLVFDARGASGGGRGAAAVLLAEPSEGGTGRVLTRLDSLRFLTAEAQEGLTGPSEGVEKGGGEGGGGRQPRRAIRLRWLGPYGSTPPRLFDGGGCMDVFFETEEGRDLCLGAVEGRLEEARRWAGSELAERLRKEMASLSI